MWVGFTAFVVVAIAIDLVVMEHQGAHEVSVREATHWSLLWIFLSLLFAAALWAYLDASEDRATANEVALQFLTGYLVEKSLSVDNIFVFLLLFRYFAVPPQYQKRVLILGIIGSIILRTALILMGAWLLARFHWLLYLFGVFLVITGIKMWAGAGKTVDLSANPVLGLLRRHIRIADQFHGERLSTLVQGQKHFTPLFVVLVLIGTTDIMFAIDSIPAIFAITSDPFIVLTANIFAILGLRALYFLLAHLAHRFHLLAYGLALVLVFIGIKMLLVDVYKIPAGWALLVTAILIAGSIILSLRYTDQSSASAKK